MECRNLCKVYDYRIFGVWESAVAIPIIWQSKSDPYDMLMLGVLTLNSNRRLIPRAELDVSIAKKLDRKRVLSLSIMSFLDAKQATLLEESLTEVGLSFVTFLYKSI